MSGPRCWPRPPRRRCCSRSAVRAGRRRTTPARAARRVLRPDAGVRRARPGRQPGLDGGAPARPPREPQHSGGVPRGGQRCARLGGGPGRRRGHRDHRMDPGGRRRVGGDRGAHPAPHAAAAAGDDRRAAGVHPQGPGPRRRPPAHPARCRTSTACTTCTPRSSAPGCRSSPRTWWSRRTASGTATCPQCWTGCSPASPTRSGSSCTTRRSSSSPSATRGTRARHHS